MDWLFASDVLTGLALSLVAGLCTGVGAAAALFLRKLDMRVLTFALGASAGVMVYVSFMELMPHATQMLSSQGHGKWMTMLFFFGGMALACLIDRLIPEDENPHEAPGGHADNCTDAQNCELPQVQPQAGHEDGQFSGMAGVKRSAWLFMLAIGIHNFPEGMATAASALDSTGIALSIALAVAIHNIPEGLVVALPLLYGTGSRKKAFLYGTLSGLAEPAGALIGLLVLLPFLSSGVMGALFCLVAGIMVYISFDELLPMAERWGHHHLSIAGVITGMAIIACTL